MRTVPHAWVSRRRQDQTIKGLRELIDLGLIRWNCPHLGPEDWPDDMPIPVEYTGKADTIRTEG